MDQMIYTIGHSKHSTERLIELLHQHQITAVADVRSQPFSRFSPRFNKDRLRLDLNAAGIAYVFLGRELGARTTDAACYIDGKVDYGLLARTSLFQEGLVRVIRGAATQRVSLLCSEKDPLVCHRTLLVCRHLVDRGLRPHHVLEDGTVESHARAMARLMEELSLHQDELFTTDAERLTEAYVRRGTEIAYGEKVEKAEKPLPAGETLV